MYVMPSALATSCPRFPGRIRRLLALACFGVATAVGCFGQANSLTTCAEVRALPREAAGRRQPVSLHGVVALGDPSFTESCVLQDSTAGVFVRGVRSANGGTALTPGMRVEVRGETAAGRFAPVVEARSVVVLGRAELGPAPRRSLQELLSGAQDSQRVEIEGVVQRVETRGTRAAVIVETGVGRFTTLVGSADREHLSTLLDTRVVVRGVCFSVFNRRGEFLGVNLHPALPSDIRQLGGPVRDPFQAPLVPLDRLQPFSPEGLPLHRQRVRGVVTLVTPEYFYVQEGRRGVRIRTQSAELPSSGDQVEVVGFLVRAEHVLEVQEAIFRRIGTAQPPLPAFVTSVEVLSPWHPGMDASQTDFDGCLVRMEGRVIRVEPRSANGSPQLLVENAGHIVAGVLAPATHATGWDALRIGSDVRITGVCDVAYREAGLASPFPQPASFRLLLRSGADVEVTHAASSWTPARLAGALGGTAAILLVALVWAMTLRYRLGLQTRRLTAEMRARRDAAVEFDATLRERSRLAADLHDTLEQALTGVAFRVEAMAARRDREQPDRDALEQVRKLVASVREDVRRSVWNLRATALENGNLAEALEQIAARLRSGDAPAIKVSVEGASRVLPEFVGGNILLLAQEALTNAHKHASASSIHVRIRFSDTQVQLTVEDDGCGFIPAQRPGTREGHFGLDGMRERLKRLAGTFEVASAPGQGTRITITVPTRRFDAALAV